MKKFISPPNMEADRSFFLQSSISPTLKILLNEGKYRGWVRVQFFCKRWGEIWRYGRWVGDVVMDTSILLGALLPRSSM